MKRTLGWVLSATAATFTVMSLAVFFLSIVQIPLDATPLDWLSVPIFAAFIIDVLLRAFKWAGMSQSYQVTTQEVMVFKQPNKSFSEAAPHAPAWMMKAAWVLEWFAIAAIVVAVILMWVEAADVTVIVNGMYSGAALHLGWLVMTIGYSIARTPEPTPWVSPRS